jgi:hypothetical protein
LVLETWQGVFHDEEFFYSEQCADAGWFPIIVDGMTAIVSEI